MERVRDWFTMFSDVVKNAGMMNTLPPTNIWKLSRKQELLIEPKCLSGARGRTLPPRLFQAP